MAANNRLGAEPHECLANAIVFQAVSDYRRVLKNIKSHPRSRESVREALEIEDFFRSVWYAQLTDVEGEYLIRRIRDEVGNPEINRNRKQSKRTEANK